MPWTWRDELIEAFTELQGVADYKQLKEAVQRRGRKNWVAHSVRQCIEDHSSDSRSFRTGINLFYSVEGLGRGIWGLRGYVQDTPEAIDKETDEPPARIEIKTYRILRDTRLARELKALYNNCCQICGRYIELAGTSRYSEAHHIRPLGGMHRGLDIAGNIIVLCPNHHVSFDYHSIGIVPDTMRIVSIGKDSVFNGNKLVLHENHSLDRISLEYYMNNIFNKF